jgi:TldD protein
MQLRSLSPAGVGWELYRGQPLRDQIDRAIAEAKEDMMLPLKPIDVGRYNIVMDAWSLAHLTSETIGLASELDRALGYEANAGGTSYLNDPKEMLGTFPVGASLLNATGNRNEPGAIATVQWDDEGVSPVSFPILKDGILTNYSTTREGAGWLKDYYNRVQRPLRSHGCAVGGDDLLGGIHVPLGQTPNIAIAPGTESLDYAASVTELGNGIAWKNMKFDMDFQQGAGMGRGTAYEVRGGKITALLANSGILFKSTELLKNLIRLGGASSVERYGMRVSKGEPPQHAFHSVSAVPATFKDATVIDPRRKA